MKSSLLFKAVFFTALLLTTSLNATYVFATKDLLNEKAIEKIEQIGAELKSKANLSVYLYANDTIEGKTMVEYREEIRKKYTDNFIVLLFAHKEQKVEIISSDNLKNRFDKEEILDPFSGTIIPLLIAKPKKDAIDDRVSAALLNGYADIADQVSTSFNIELDTGIGNSNRDIINTIRVVFYTVIVIVLIVYFRKKLARKKS